MAAMIFTFVLGLLSVSMLDAFSFKGDIKTERDLRRDIFEGYDKLVRPVKRYSTAVPLAVSLSPVSLKSLDLNIQEMKMDTFLLLKWTDEYLQWNPLEYDNITELRVSSSTIWKPDLSLYTATPDKALFPIVQTQAIVYSNGNVLWVPYFTTNSRCSVPPNRSSKDVVMCSLQFGSWTFSGNQVDLQLGSDKVDMEYYVDYNPKWKLVEAVSNRVAKHYDCCEEAYPVVNFNFTFKKRSYDVEGSKFVMNLLN